MKELFKFQKEKYVVWEYLDFNSIENKIPMSFRKKKNFHYELRNQYNTENIFEENYGNILSTVHKSYLMVVVSQDGDKVSIKIFSGEKVRRRGNKFFRIRKNLTFLTFNTRTGDYYDGHLTNYNLKRKSSSTLRRNYYPSGKLNNILNVLRHMFRDFVEPQEDVSWIVESVKNTFTQAIQVPHDVPTKDVILKKYLDIKGIKYPNNFHVFYESDNFRIPIKNLRSQDMKLVETFMKDNNLRGDKVKKALHNCDNINLNLLKISYRTFGEHSINSDYDLILNLLNHNNIIIDPFNYFVNYVAPTSKKERLKCFNFFKKILIEKSLDLYTFLEHLSFYNELKHYGENIRWSTETIEHFREEHLDWVDMLSFYKNGKYFRVYPDSLIQLMNEPISTNQENYYPILLSSSEEFNQESSIQSNCVKTYIGRASSVLISLRRGSPESEDRATIEYAISKKENSKVFSERVQFLGKYNTKLAQDWEPILKKLDGIIYNFVKGKQFETVKLKKILSNGNELFSDSHFSHEGKITWSYNKIVS